MATFYVELKLAAKAGMGGRVVEPGIWRFEKKPDPVASEPSVGKNLMRSMPSTVAYTAERIWLEEDDRVTYVKNRFDHNNVDMEEFVWVKLQAKTL